MPRVLIWDLPVRLFHLVFAGGIASAAVIALVLGDDGPLFPHHAMIGLTVAVALALRVAWGFAGSRHARFASFAFGPAAAVRYMGATLRGKGPRFAGHNPGAAHAAFAMYALMALLTVSGVTLALGNPDAKQAHEFFAYAMLGAIGAHLAGLALHTAVHRELIGLSMVTGRKEAEPAESIRSSHPVVALLFLLVVAGFAAALWRNYDGATVTTRLPIVGTVLALGEQESDDAEHGAADGAGPRDEDDDDDD